LTLGKPGLINNWVKGLRTYMGAFVGWEDGSIRVITNKAVVIPDDVAMAITADDILKDSLRLSRRSLRSVPNSVAVDYEDSSGTKWHTERVQSDSGKVTSGDEVRRLSRISLPGIHNASQAQREATERLNWYLTDLEAVLTIFDPGWNLQIGSIVSVTHPIGLDAKLFRVRKITGRSGRWTLDLVEYDPAVYSEEVIANPTTPDVNLGNPLAPPTVSGLVGNVAEELFKYKNGLTGSRVRASWDATNFPFFSQYFIEGYVEGVLVWQTSTQTSSVVTPGVEELISDAPVEYEIRVYVQSPFAQGDPATETTEIAGKFLVPANVTTLTATRTSADTVALAWNEVDDIDIWRYEVRVGDPVTADTWAEATLLELVDGLNYVTTGLSIEDHRFFVKARDSVGNESDAAKTVDISLSRPEAVSSLSGFEVASEVRLNWPAVTTGFVERYRIAFDEVVPSAEVTLDIVDTLRFQTKDVPEGTWKFLVYAVDKNGIESASAATIDIEVTSDADAFLADLYSFNNPGTLTNMVSYTLRLDDVTYYVTSMGEAFAVTPTDFVVSDPLANYHSDGASTWLSENKDFGLLLTGSWNLTHNTTTLQGNVLIELELSAEDDGSPSEGSFTKFTGAAKGAFRHARVRITTSNPPGTATAFIKTPLMDLKINVVPIEEAGEGTSDASSGVGSTVQLSKEYTALKEISVQPKNTQSKVTAVVDNIVVGPNTAVMGDGTNYLSVPDSDILDFGATDNLSVECMLRHSGEVTGFQAGLQKMNAVGYGVGIDETLDRLNFFIYDGTIGGGDTANGSFPDDGEYHHFAATVDRTADELRLYVNGVEDVSSPFDISAVTGSIENSSPLNVLADGDGLNQYGGAIDELRIWNDVRSEAEILANYQKEIDPASAGLVGYWKMNGSVSASVTTVQDETTNNNDLDDTGGGELVYVDPGEAGNLIQKINSFDVYIFDIFGQQVAEDFQWNWKAV